MKTITIYTSRKSNTEYTLVKMDETEGKAVIKDNQDKLHLVSLSTLKKSYKKTVVEVKDEPKEETKVKAKKFSTQSSGERKNVKGDPENVKENEVVLKAFTGMIIGVFEVTKRTSKTVTVKTAKGELKFDAKTGIQIDASNPKFANRIAV